MSTPKETVVLKGRVEHDTGKALLFETLDGDGLKLKIWFPLQFVNKIEKNGAEKLDEITVETWIAKSKGLV